jgi:hypothetical protein
MGDIAVSAKVIARDEFGRFIEACRIGGTETMRDISEKGAQLSRELAPIGKKPDPRGPRIVDSITSYYTSTTAHWQAATPWAIDQELGAGAHEIPGNVSFFWEREGRMWHPGDNTIHHPGNRPQPYLRPSYQAMMAQCLAIARTHYPQ